MVNFLLLWILGRRHTAPRPCPSWSVSFLISWGRLVGSFSRNFFTGDNRLRLFCRTFRFLHWDSPRWTSASFLRWFWISLRSFGVDTFIFFGQLAWRGFWWRSWRWSRSFLAKNHSLYFVPFFIGAFVTLEDRPAFTRSLTFIVTKFSLGLLKWLFLFGSCQSLYLTKQKFFLVIG